MTGNGSGNSAQSAGIICITAGANLPMINNIVCDNPGGSVDGDSNPIINYSCIEDKSVWAGEGNLNLNPLFCKGWERQEVWVDPSWGAPGDGSEGNPFSDPRLATMGNSFSLALSASSPCWGSGKDGSDMGSDTGRCDKPARTSRIVHLAPGVYKAEDFELTHHVSLLGSGEDVTVLERRVEGFRCGSLLWNLTVTKGTNGGIVVSGGESAEISSCTMSGNSWGHQVSIRWTG